MSVDIKFCGLTRAADAAEAGRLGAAYVGVIFAGGPRRLDPAVARAVQGAAPASVRRVGVFGEESAESIATVVRDVGLDVVQLHGDPGPRQVEEVRAACGREVWAAVRTTDRLPESAAELFAIADVVILDARVDGALGGTGVPIPWDTLASQVSRARDGRPGRLAVAGGLRPGNVGAAIAALHPDIVDVSSGVERTPGVKDHELMRAFAQAVGRAGN